MFGLFYRISFVFNLSMLKLGKVREYKTEKADPVIKKFIFDYLVSKFRYYLANTVWKFNRKAISLLF